VTCSPRSFDLVKSLGADAAFDYKSPTAATDIKEFTKGKLQHAWDCIGNAESAKLCVSAMTDGDSRYASIVRVDDGIIHSVNPKTIVSFTVAYTIFGESFELFNVTPPIPEDFEFGKMFWELSRGLLASGKVKTVKEEVNRGGKGLEGVLVGLKEMKEGRFRGGKLVYTL
jgi:NADPH:quinone reductase-like Zn-dependent oxidoreductase